MHSKINARCCDSSGKNKIMNNDFHTANLLNELTSQISRKILLHQEEYIKGNLIAMGFVFNDRNEFINFVSNRITKLQHQSGEVYLFLDYVDDYNKGKYVGSWEDRIEILPHGHSLVFTFNLINLK